MTLWKRLALWFACCTGLIPKVRHDWIEDAIEHIQSAQARFKSESSEYRRHMAYAQLTAQGLTKRQASMALEIALGLAKGA